MGALGKGMVSLSSQTSAEKRTYIDVRGDRLEWTRSEVVTQLVDFWFAMGAPPLSALDALAPAIPIPEACRVAVPPFWASIGSGIEKGDAEKAVASAIRGRRPKSGDSAQRSSHASHK
jgi:hypothetical protein